MERGETPMYTFGGCFPGAQSNGGDRGKEINRIRSDRGSLGCSGPTEESQKQADLGRIFEEWLTRQW